MVIAAFIFLPVVTVLFLLACVKIEWLQQEVRAETELRRRDAFQFVDQLVEVGTAMTGASLLRRLADQWDHPAEQGNLNRLAREQYELGGPSMPTIWLRQQANKLDGGES